MGPYLLAKVIDQPSIPQHVQRRIAAFASWIVVVAVYDEHLFAYKSAISTKIALA